jgi:acyl carrier protein
MDNVEARLLRCFSVIFPDLKENDLSNASMENVEDWDSVATVTLINVVEEEFDIQIALEDIEDVMSFSQFLNYLKTRKVAVT